MNTDKAYLIGLIVGGGIFGNAEDGFKIRLPFREWGSFTTNPERAGRIARDILEKVGNAFRAIYNLTVQYETTEGGLWIILCEGDLTALKEDLQHYGIICEGTVWNNFSFNLILQSLVDINLKRRFVAGLADTIGSTAKTHRRFNDEHQILSFEIRGFDFSKVCSLCNLLYDINCIPDQINWNHPNIHCSKDPYYDQWKKGFKLRVLLDQYAQFGAFAFRTKAESSRSNRTLQQQEHEAIKCEEKPIISCKPACVHPAENSELLPLNIRGGHYIHYSHFCAVLNCEHAPYEAIQEKFKDLGSLVNPFPIISKGSKKDIDSIIENNDIYNNRTYRVESFTIQSLLSLFKRNKKVLLYPQEEGTGYPIDLILQAVAFIIASPDELAGTRTRGNYLNLLKSHINQGNNQSISLQIPDLLTPLIIEGNDRAALIGPLNPSVYHHLISFDQNNPYKLLVRQITEEDLR